MTHPIEGTAGISCDPEKRYVDEGTPEGVATTTKRQTEHEPPAATDPSAVNNNQSSAAPENVAAVRSWTRLSATNGGSQRERASVSAANPATSPPIGNNHQRLFSLQMSDAAHLQAVAAVRRVVVDRSHRRRSSSIAMSWFLLGVSAAFSAIVVLSIVCYLNSFLPTSPHPSHSPPQPQSQPQLLTYTNTQYTP